MGVVGKVKVMGPNGVFTVDVVDLGDSQTGHSLRIRTPKGIKEFNLVTLDDIRASALRVNTPWGVLAIAKDGSNVRSHESDAVLYAFEGEGEMPTRSVLLGRTELNKVVRLAMDVRLHVRISCGMNFGFTSGFDRANTRARLRAVHVGSGTTYTSGEVSVSRSLRHNAFSDLIDWGTYKNATVVLSGLPPGKYDVYMLMNGWRGPSEGHLSDVSEAAAHEVKCYAWREYTK